ncbi:hypothetical protein B0H13DRAFT_1916532 [Mycena leptocephala]|nr:hypothetical protein B0H13DRAFT_1916532 [Mycena leptocephala]
MSPPYNAFNIASWRGVLLKRKPRVPTPFNYGYGKDPGAAFVEDLWMHAWVSTEREGVIDLGACTRTVTARDMPDLKFSYTIAFLPPRARDDNTPSNNSCLADVLEMPWHENVLVMKHDIHRHPVDLVSDNNDEATQGRWKLSELGISLAEKRGSPFFLTKTGLRLLRRTSRRKQRSPISVIKIGPGLSNQDLHFGC